MINKARCKLCDSIIESFHPQDFVECKCGEIEVYGGAALYCRARDFGNFIRIDDQGNEFEPKIIDKEMPCRTTLADDIPKVVEVKELIEMLDDMAKSIDNLPQQAMIAPITHYDFYSLILLLSSIFKGLDDASD